MIAQDSLQERLAAAYRLQAKHYDEALHIATQDGQAFDQDAWVHDLQTTLQAIAAVDEQMAPDKLAWRVSGQKPDADLRDVLDALSGAIQRLADAIDRRSEELTRRKQRLLPVLDEFIRQRQMLSSYAQFGMIK